MPGQQIKNQGLGSTNEAFCEAMLGRLASMISVPREHDFGVDFYCLPRRDISAQCETVSDICGVQVKSSESGGLRFGGISDKGNWQKHQLEWLRCLTVPFYLAVVDADFHRVDVYSITRCLQVFWKTDYPFRIDCKPVAANLSAPVETQEPVATPVPEHSQYGDGKVWSVELGVPFLSLTFRDLIDEPERNKRSDILLAWIAIDRWSLNNLVSGIPRVRLFQSYRTNERPSNEQLLMFWYPASESRARQMAEIIAPGIVCVAKQLQSQGKVSEACQWVGPLQWCKERGALDRLGLDLIDELRGPDS